MYKVEHKFPYKWYLKDGYPAKGIEKHNTKVFSCFASGGGSTMGYKLAGFNVIGANEFVEDYANCYKINHNPKYLFVEDIRTFKNRKDLPQELFELDILDGSPPCSAFSMAGKREEGWGIEKDYANGRKKQVVDDLYFEFIEFIKRLQPKVVVAENVKGMLIGNAKIYCKKIKQAFIEAGYEVQLFLLNASTMGVPQKRERVFFVARRKDLNLPELKLSFNEKEIVFGGLTQSTGKKLSPDTLFYKKWLQRIKSDTDLAAIYERTEKRQTNFSTKIIHKDKVPFTITCGSSYIKFDKPELLSDLDYCQIGSYPLDYNFMKLQPQELIGRAVPPVMMAQLSHQIYLYWFKK